MSIEIDTDKKYVTFKRADFIRVMGEDADVAAYELPDAVVIRRQDLFAAPALATYASCIAMSAKLSTNEVRKQLLLDIADYFERQAQIAADEGWKFPDV